MMMQGAQVEAGNEPCVLKALGDGRAVDHSVRYIRRDVQGSTRPFVDPAPYPLLASPCPRRPSSASRLIDRMVEQPRP